MISGRMASFESPEINLAVTGATQIVPAGVGRRFKPLFIVLYMTQTAGAQSTPPSVQFGNNSATFNNALAADTSFPGGTIFALGAFGHATRTPLTGYVLTTSAYNVNVTVAGTGTGGYVAKCKYVLVGIWVPAG